jgi:SNF2 family DNA or RNA helicase
MSLHMIRRFKKDLIGHFPKLIANIKTHDYKSDTSLSMNFSFRGKLRAFHVHTDTTNSRKAAMLQRQLASHPALALRDAENLDAPLDQATWTAIIYHFQNNASVPGSPRYALAAQLHKTYVEQKHRWTIIDSKDPKWKRYFRCKVCDINRAKEYYTEKPTCSYHDNAIPEDQELVFCLRYHKEHARPYFEEAGELHRHCQPCRDTGKTYPKLPKTLVFSPFTRSLNLFGLYLQQQGHVPSDAIYRVDGTVPLDKRAAIISQSQADKRPTCIMLASVKCASEGLNVTEANLVMFLDVTYCPGNEVHALSRAHRIMQKHTVVSLMLRAEGCEAEDKLFERRSVKDGLVKGIVDGGRDSRAQVLRPEDFVEDDDVRQLGDDMAFEKDI